MSVPAGAQEVLDFYIEQQRLARAKYAISEVLLVLLAASIPVVSLLNPKDAIPAAWIGAVVAVLVGFRPVFPWHRNWRRFASAQVAANGEVRLYNVGVAPYDDAATRDGVLVTRLTDVERAETAEWGKQAGPA